MKLHATLRRTLALLLVLIFAMSNIGLAEVAEQLTQYDEVPVIFAEYDEADAEEAAKEPEPEADAEPEGEAESQAPEEIVVEEEAPAPEVSAEAYLLDPDSIFADASVANYDGELGYAWERAGEDGEWTAIDGANEAIYVNTDEDREAYAYRCVVSAGDVAAESNAVEFGTVAFISDDAMDGFSIQAASFASSLDSTKLGSEGENYKVTISAAEPVSGNNLIATAGTTQITLTANVTENAGGDISDVTPDEGDGLTYTWTLGSTARAVFESVGELTTSNAKAWSNTLTLKVKSDAGLRTSAKDITSSDISVKVTTSYDSDGISDTLDSDLSVYKAIDDTEMGTAIVTVDTESPVVQPAESTSNLTVTLGGGIASLDAVYKPTYHVRTNGGEEDDAADWFDLSDSTKVKVKAAEDGKNKYSDTDAAKQFQVGVSYGDSTTKWSDPFYVYAQTTGVELQDEKGTKIADDAQLYLMEGNSVTLKAKVLPAAAKENAEGSAATAFKWAADSDNSKFFNESADLTSGTSNTIKLTAQDSGSALSEQDTAVKITVTVDTNKTDDVTINLIKKLDATKNDGCKDFFKVEPSDVGYGSTAQISLVEGKEFSKGYTLTYTPTGEHVSLVSVDKTGKVTVGEAPADATDKTVTINVGAEGCDGFEVPLTLNIKKNSTKVKIVKAGEEKATDPATSATVVGAGSTIDLAIAEDGRSDTDTVTWTLTQNDIDDYGNTKILTAESYTTKADATLTLTVNEAVTSSPKKPVIVTASVPDGKGGTLTSEAFEITVLAARTKPTTNPTLALSGADLYASSTEEQAAKDTLAQIEGKTATFNITLPADAQNLPVVWSIADPSANGDDGKTTASNFLTIKDGVVTVVKPDAAGGDTDNQIKTGNGILEFTVTANVLYANNTNDYKATKTIKLQKVANGEEDLRIGKVTTDADGKDTSAAFGGLPEMGVGDTLKVVLELADGKYGYVGDVDGWEVELKDDKGVVEPVSVTKSGNTATIKPNKAGTMTIKADSKAGGTATQEITVKPQPEVVTIVASTKSSADDDASNAVFVDTTPAEAADLPIYLSAKITDKEGKDMSDTAYTGGMTWSIVDSTQSYGLTKGAIAKVDDDTKRTVTIGKDNVSAGWIQVRVSWGTDASALETIKVISNELADASKLTDKTVLIDGLKNLATDGAGGAANYVVQGDSFTVKLSDAWKTASVGGETNYNLNYPVKLSISSTEIGLSNAEGLKKYFDVITNDVSKSPMSTAQTSLTIKAKEQYTDPEDTTTAEEEKPIVNPITNADGYTITVKAEILGFSGDGSSYTSTIKLLPAPDSAKIEKLTAQPEDEPTPSALTDADKVLLKDKSITLRATPIGPMTATAPKNGEVKTIGSIKSFTVTKSVPEGICTVSESAPTGKNYRELTLTAKGAGTVTVTAVTNNDKKLETVFTFGDDASSAGGIEVDTDASAKYAAIHTSATSVKQHTHDWVLMAADEGSSTVNEIKKDDPTGHRYYCSDETCAAVSKFVKHTFVPVEGDFGKTASLRLKGATKDLDQKSLNCTLCGWTCNHTTEFPKTGTVAERVDENLHKGVCGTCGQTLYAAHQAGTTFCEDCQNSTAVVSFDSDTINVLYDASKETQDTEDISDKLNIVGAASYSVAYATTSDKIDVNSVTGVVTPKAPMAKDEKATVTATVTINTNAVESGKLTLSDTVDIIVVEKPASVTIEGQDWIQTAGAAIKLTATPDTANADMSEYQWSVDGNANFKWYANEKDETTKEDKAAASPLDDNTATKGMTVVWLAAESDAKITTEDAKKLTITYGVEEDPADGTKHWTKQIDLLAEYDTSSKLFELVSSIAPDATGTDSTAVNVGQSRGSFTISMKDYNANYGDKIVYTVTDSTEEMPQYKMDRWFTTSVANDVLTIKLNAPGTDNDLSKEADNKIEFTVTAKIQVANTDPDAEAGAMKDKATSKKYKFAIVPDPDKIDFYVSDDKGQLDGDASGLTPADKVDTTGTTIFDDETFYVRAVAAPKASETIEDVAVDLTTENATFKIEKAFTADEIKADATKATVYKVTVKEDAANLTSGITSAAIYSGKTATLPVTVKETFKSVALDAEGLKGIGAGEDTKTVTITATTEPAIAAGKTDTLTWEVDSYTNVDAEGKPTDPTTFASNTDGIKYELKDGKMTFTVPESLTTARKLYVKVTAGHTTEKATADAEPTLVERAIPLDIYKTADASAFKLDVKKTDPNADIIVGETYTLDYDWADGYGWTQGNAPDLIALDAKNAANESVADASTIIDLKKTVDEKTQKNVWTFTAKAAGSVALEARAYNYDTLSHFDCKARLEIKVVGGPEVVRIKADKKEAHTTVHEFGENDTNAKYEILKTDFEVKGLDASGNEIDYTNKYTMILKPEVEGDETVVITEKPDQTGWVISGGKYDAANNGEMNIYAWVGDQHSEAIPVKVLPAPSAINFYDENGNVITEQIKQDVTTGLKPVVLEAKTTPADTLGTIKVTCDPASAMTETDGKYTVTPTTVGTYTVTATVYNKDYKEGESTSATSANLTAIVEIVVTQEPVVEPVSASIEFAGKSAIGIGEQTTAVAVGTEEGATPVWDVKAGSETFIKVVDKAKGIFEGVAAGTATITCTIGDGTIEKEIEVLSAITKVELLQPLTQLSIGETIVLEPVIKEGYTSAKVEVPDQTGLVSFTTASTNITLSSDANGVYSVTGVKKGSASLTMNIKGAQPQTIPITVTNKNSSFNIGAYNGSTLYIKPGEGETIIPTFLPKNKNTYANLEWVVTGSENNVGIAGDVYYDFATSKITASENAEPDDVYNVVVREKGFANRATQSFTVIIADPDATAETPSIVVDKIGFEGAYTAETLSAGAVTIAHGEKLQAKLVNKSGAALSGVTWAKSGKETYAKISSTGVITTKKKGGSFKFTASYGGTTYGPFTVTVKAAPKFKLAPADTERTVAIGEPFELGLSGTYPGTASEWFDVTNCTKDLGLEPVDETLKPGWYTFEAAGTTTVTLTTSWGKTANETFHVLDADVAEAADISLAQNVTVLATGSVRVKAEVTDGAYASLDWTVDGQDVTTSLKAVKGNTKFKVQKLANDEILIKTSKAKSGASATVAVKPHGAEEAAATTTVSVDAKDTDLGAAELTFAKNVIGVGEKTTAYVAMTNGEALPTGKITYATGSKNVTINEKGVVTAHKPGTYTVSVKFNGKDTSISAPLYVLSKASIATDMMLTKMAPGEEVTIGVTINGYAPEAQLPEGCDIDTSDILTVSSNNEELVSAELTPAEAENETETNTKHYELTLTANVPQKDAKDKFVAAKVTLALNNGVKATTMNIQVVDEEAENKNIYYPTKVYVQKGKTLVLNAAITETAAANFKWSFKDPAKAEAAQLSFSAPATVKAASGAATGASAEIIGTRSDGYTIESTVIVGKKVTNKKQIIINLPKDTMALGEKMAAYVTFTDDYGSTVKWSSKSKAIASVDANGVITANKKGTTYIYATVNGKKQQAKLTVSATAPTSIAFTQDEYTVATGTETFDLHDKVTGVTLAKEASYESAFSFSYEPVGETDIVNTFDERSGKITFVANAEGMVKVTVTSYNGLIDDCLVVLGDAGKIEIAPAVPTDIGLRLNNEVLSNGNTLTVNEGDTLNIRAIVKDANGYDITDRVKVNWATSPVNDERVEFLDDKGTLKAKKTTSTSTGPETITVTASVEGLQKTATYGVTISPKMSAAHMVFEVPKTMIKGKKATVEYSLSNNVTVPEDLTLVIESSDPKSVTVAQKAEALAANIYEITAINGSATISVYYKDTDGKHVYEMDPQTVTVIDMPTGDDLQIDVKSDLTLGQNETYDFTAKFVTADYTADTSGSLKFKAWEIGENTDGSEKFVAPETGTTVTAKAGAESTWTITAPSTISTKKKIAIAAYAFYDGDPGETVEPIKTFYVTLEHTTFTLEVKSNASRKMYGKDETVHLVLKKTGNGWANAEFELTDDVGLGTDVVKPVYTEVKANEEWDMTYAMPATLDSKPIAVQAKHKNIPTGQDDKYPQINPVSITFCSVVTFDSSTGVKGIVTGASQAVPETIGVGESADISFTFAANYFSNKEKITWESSQSNVKLEAQETDASTRKAVCKITGQTASSTKTHITAKVNNVVVYESDVTVVNPMTSIDLWQKNTGSADTKFVNELSKATAKTIYVKAAEGTSATCSINLYLIKSGTTTMTDITKTSGVITEGDKNTWKIDMSKVTGSPEAAANDLVKIVITTSDGSLRAQFEAKVVN